MLVIRASLLYNLAASSFDVVKSSTVIEILYSHRLLRYATKYSYYLFLIEQYDPPDKADSQVDHGVISMVFEEFTDEFVAMFIDDGYSMGDITNMCDKLLFVMDELAGEQIIINNYGGNITYGMEKEKKAIQLLNQIGIEIGDMKSTNCVIEHDGLPIQLNGRPDGVVLKSPGDCIKPGTLVEIKSKREDGNAFRGYDLFQMSAYALIFNQDVLYVKIFGDDRVECELLDASYLRDKFYSRQEHVIHNCKRIHELIESCGQEKDKMKELVKLCTKGRY